MESALSIRRATSADRDHIWAVRTEAIFGISDPHYTGAELRRWAEVEMPDAFTQLVSDWPFLVAERHGVLIGHGFLDASEGRIEGMFVRPACQRHGVGGRILEALERRAQEMGLDRLELAATWNAVPFYRRAGFASLGASSYLHPAGFELPCMLMVKTMG